MHYLRLSVLSVLVAAPLHNFANSLASHWDDMCVKHTWKSIPPNWEPLGYPPAGVTIDLHIALKHHHENALTDALYEVSEPKSQKYGAHLSPEQVAQLVAPHPDTLDLIHSWLEHHDVQSSSISTSHGDSWLTVTGVPVPKANELLGASYQLYRRTGTNDTTFLRTIGYSLPRVLHPHVKTVVPTTYFGSTRTLSHTRRKRSVGASAEMESRELSRAHSGRDDDDDDDEITPSDLRSLYRTTAYVPGAVGRNVLAIMGLLNGYPSRNDLRKFMAEYRKDGVDATYSEVTEGYKDDLRFTAHEMNINMQYAQAIAYPTTHIFYSTGGVISVDNEEPARADKFMLWLKVMANLPDVPQTISISYSDYENDVPLDYAETVCDLFKGLGARGASVIIPSGNDGVGDGQCIDYDGRVQFVPEFPASCPFVTSVGGTKGRPEVGAGLSGGGFSNHFPRPDYQEDYVPIFLGGLHGQHVGLYNANGRGIPDIAAQALKCPNINNNEELVSSGTGCAAPTVAGIISLLNDFMVTSGKPPLGFLNPWLYGRGLPGITDVTEGSNPGCGTLGFSATGGWDPVTGLGTPDFWIMQYILYLKVMMGDTSE